MQLKKILRVAVHVPLLFFAAFGFVGGLSWGAVLAGVSYAKDFLRWLY